MRSILIRGEHWPRQPPADSFSALAEGLRHWTLTADELVQCCCAAIHAQTGSYQETALRLGLDPRTVRDKMNAWTRRARDGTRN